MADSVLGAYASAFAAANAANEARYSSILSGYGDRENYYSKATKEVRTGYDDVLKRQERIGDSQRIDLQDQYARNLAQTKASMFNRGLGASTLYDSAQRGVNADLARSKIALEDSLAREYADVAQKRLGFLERANVFGRSAIKKDKLDFMERKQELGPQAGLYAQLAEMEGRGDAGPFGGGGIGGGGGAFGSPGRMGGMAAAAGISNPIQRPVSSVWGSNIDNASIGSWQAAQMGTNNALAAAMGGMMGGAGGGGGAMSSILQGAAGALGSAAMGYRQQVNNMPAMPGGGSYYPSDMIGSSAGSAWPYAGAAQSPYGIPFGGYVDESGSPYANAGIGGMMGGSSGYFTSPPTVRIDPMSVYGPTYSGNYGVDAGVGFGGYFSTLGNDGGDW